MKRFYLYGGRQSQLSQLGITAATTIAATAFSGSIWTMPTTGEFDRAAAFGDRRGHQELATRFGLSMCHARESPLRSRWPGAQAQPAQALGRRSTH